MKPEQQLPQCFTLRTDDADLESLTARAPSASQSDETEMNGAASTMCVCVCMVPNMRSGDLQAPVRESPIANQV